MRTLSVVLVAFVLSGPGVGQRVIPPTRDQNPTPAIRHLQVKPQNVRGTSFVLGRNENAEAFWSRYMDNRAAVEFRMAMLAREGVNQVRQWSSYRSYLFGRYIGYSTGAPTNGHWSRVRDFCDLAHDYDIAVSLVLFNTFGETPLTEEWVAGPGTLPPGERIVAEGPDHVRLRLNCFVPGCTTWESIKRRVGHPDILASHAADPTALFASTEWRDDQNGPFPGFLDGYLNQMNAGTTPPTKSKGLQELEFVNEPEHLATLPRGLQCLKVLQKVNVAGVNPDNVPLVLATAAPRSLANRTPNCTLNCYPTNPLDPFNLEMISTGFDDGNSPPPVALLDHWTMHGALTHVFHYQQTSINPHYNSAQFNYARGSVPNDDFLNDLRNHSALGGRGPIQRRGLVLEEAICRAGTLQRMVDVQRYTVLDSNPDPSSQTFNRGGTSTWSHLTSDAPKAEFGPFVLPCGFSLSPYEREAFNDNWRALTSSLGGGALSNPSDPLVGNGLVNPGVVVVDRDLSDAVQVGLAQSPDRKAMLVVYADNYSTKTTHSVTDPVSPPPSHAKENRLFARVRWEDPNQAGTWLWYPDPALGQPALVLDVSPGPLLFDEARNSVTSYSQLDTSHVDSRYSAAMGYTNSPPQRPVDYNGVDWVPPTGYVYGPNPPPPPYIFSPYLRLDAANRIKRRNADCDLAPSVVFQKQAGSQYRFFVAWSRPVPKTGTGINNSGENYFPDQDSEQAYFAMHKGHVVGDSTTYRKYEVLVQEVTVNASTALGNVPIPQPLPAIKVMRTQGELVESSSNGGPMLSQGLALDKAGASAMHPRLFVEPAKGHVVLAYMKSQDSWFDIAAHPGGLSGAPNLAPWEQACTWHVYPWEVWCKVFAEYGDAATLNGAWVQVTPEEGLPPVDGEWRVNDQYLNGGLAGWLSDHRYAAPFHGEGMPASAKGQFTAEYFPAIDPGGTAWMEGTTLNFVVSFKALNTWVDPTFWHYPHGYETMAAKFTCPIASGASTQALPARSGTARRLRVPFRGTIPVDEESPVPSPYASHEAMYDMNEAPVIYTPAFGGLKATVIAQNGQRVTLNCDAAQGTQESSIFNGLMAGSTRVFSSSMQGASVQRTNYDIVTVAWLYLHPPSQTGHANPYVDLNVWGVAGGLTGQQTYRVVLSPNEGADFQGRVLSVTPAGTDTNGHQQFAVVWHQSGRIFRLVYTLDYIPGVFPTVPPQLVFPPFTGQGQDLASVTQVAKGVTAMYGQMNSTNYLSSAKLRAAATRNAGLWAIKGWVNFKAW